MAVLSVDRPVSSEDLDNFWAKFWPGWSGQQSPFRTAVTPEQEQELFHKFVNSNDRAANVREFIPYVQTTLDDRRKTLGLHDPVTMDTIDALAASFLELEQFPQAEAAYREYVSVAQPQGTKQQSSYVGALSNLCYALIEQKKYAEAEPYIRKFIPLIIERKGAISPQAFGGPRFLIESLAGQNKFPEARQLFEETSKALAATPKNYILRKHDMVAMEKLEVKIEEMEFFARSAKGQRGFLRDY